jgi:hypothetical protein
MQKIRQFQTLAIDGENSQEKGVEHPPINEDEHRGKDAKFLHGSKLDYKADDGQDQDISDRGDEQPGSNLGET